MQLSVQRSPVQQALLGLSTHTVNLKYCRGTEYRWQETCKSAAVRRAFVPVQRPRGAAVTKVSAIAGVAASSAAPPPYGWLMVSVAFTAFALQWMAINVAKARKEAGVAYPAMVADGAVVGEKAALKFNCAQRGHQNTLETLPLLLVMQLLIAQVFPITAAALGAVWTVGRIVYVVGYTNGGPQKRIPGAAISGLTLIATTFVLSWVGFSLLRA